ncbi:flagellar hook-associated protein 3 [Hydrogenivirga caldilitoris]|uniref:Flagellar hook-associated protein 3 n=1 Tax=Hydrogenivirga caldilitoris TaxID=246264 RepID=A0A497XM10_9AQUI|nr:flagellar hook-associated protein FlgL [Hydrogenivirga caldilitoris]RLJ69875.1 flagellar hook-associated protein 3 [Hydrogenivirga caldilitoris]
MKVPDSLLYTIFQQQDEKLRESIARKTMEISTGKRVHNLSDDPVATFNILSLRKDISQLSQFSKNRLFSDVNLSYIDFTLNKVSDKIKALYTKAVQAKNELHTKDALIAMSAEFDEALGFLLDRANEKVGENYIFSGSALTTRPFSANFTYQGSQEPFNVQIDESNFTEVFSPGSRVFSTNVYQLDAFFTTPTTPFGVSGTLNVNYNSTTVSLDYGRGVWYLAGKVSDPNEPLTNYGFDGDLILYDSGMNELARISNYGQYSLNDLITQINTSFGSENISASLVTNPDGTYTLRIADGDSPADNFIADTSGNVLESNNLENFVSIFNGISPGDVNAFVHQAPSGMYTLRLAPEDVSTTLNLSFTGSGLGSFFAPNIFQLINEVKEKLANGLNPDDSDLMAVQRSYDKVVSERSRFGSILSQVKDQQPVQENRMDVLKKQKSDNEEVELSESIMEYTRYRTAYEALMRIVADTKDMTILRYI